MRYGKESIKWALIVSGHIGAEEIGDELDFVYSKAESLDRALKHIDAERRSLMQQLIGEDDEYVRYTIRGKIGTLKRVRKAMEETE